MLRLVTLALFLSSVVETALSRLELPSELYTPLIADKILQRAISTPNPMQYPQYTDRVAGDWIWFSPDLWTTGFFPSTLYAMYARAQLCPSTTGEASKWLSLGRQWSAAELPLEIKNSVGHDVGFLSFPFMDELTVNPKNSTAIAAVNAFAADLAARFSPIVGCTRSWDTSDPTDFEVIIDNMMNLQVLFASASLTGNDTLREIAISHANKTMVNHIRPDGGSFHLVVYNSTTGVVIHRGTVQGYADNSTWSRGQAWGIYGFANMYAHTHHFDYLDTARRMASYFLTNTPTDGIVPWDFNAPLTPPRPADSSAAMIAANGLILLAQQENSLSPRNLTGYTYYMDAVVKLLHDTTNLAWRPAWQSLLANGTVNNPQQNNLTGIVYGDYYFIKAGNDLITMGLTVC